MSAGAFQALHAEVMQVAQTPEQRRGADDALQLFTGVADMRVVLPPVPPLPAAVPLPAPAPAPAGVAGAAPAAPVALPLLLGGGPAAPAPRGAAAAASGFRLRGTSCPAAVSGFRLRGTSCLFTWNNSDFAGMEQATLWQAFVQFIKSLAFVSQWTATMEQSLRSHDQGRVHLHAFLEFRHAIDWTGLDLVRFMNARPNASPTRARGDNQRLVMDEGHFYVWAWKLGTVFVETSGYRPWQDYRVIGTWLDHLWSDHKLDHRTYLAYAAQVRVGFINRSKQVEAIEAKERRDYLRDRRSKVALRLAALRKDTKPEVKARLSAWEHQYTETLERFKFLVIRGASRTGKSTLARTLGGKTQTPFIQTVQSAVAPDLRAYDADFHSYIVFDNVNDMQFVMDYRALFQANNDIHTLGESKTGVYSYEVWLWRVPIVITVDLSARWNTEDDWIKENCVDLFLSGPCWVS